MHKRRNIETARQLVGVQTYAQNTPLVQRARLLAWGALGLLVALAMIGVGGVGAALAATLQSPSGVTIDHVSVFRNLIETGDMLYVFEANISFTSDNYPSEAPASDSVIYRLYDEDGTTLKSSDSAYVYPLFETNGYGMNYGSFYFSASDNAPGWGDEVVINVYCTPGFFDPAVPVDYICTLSDYTTATSPDVNQAELYNYVLLAADRLTTEFDDTGVVMTTSSDSGIVLSPYGELYFTGAITGLSALCPDLYFIQVLIPEIMEVDPYDMSLGSDIHARIDGGDMDQGMDALGVALGVDGMVAAVLVFVLLSVGACVWTIRKGWGIEPGLGISTFIGIGGAFVIGDAMFTGLMVVSLLAIMGIAYLGPYKRA